LPGLGFPAATLVELIEARAAMVCLVPSQIQVLKALGPSAPASPHMQVVNVGGGPFPSACLPSLRERFPQARIINNYGCTEALTRIASCEVTSLAHQPTDGGRPFPGLDLRIAGEQPPGRIEFRGPSVSIGYVRPDGGIDEHDGWIAGGDLGYLKEGRIQVLGRHDQLFKSGGEKLSLVEVEQALMASADVMHAVAWAAQREGLDQAPQAVIHGPCRPTPRDLQAILKKSLSPNAWPQRIFWAADWPCLPNGKPDRLQLQKQAGQGNLELIWETPRRSVG
jgi:acyl-CoA synthetase (AMP-forming)/AMP-acid ligase II